MMHHLPVSSRKCSHVSNLHTPRNCPWSLPEDLVPPQIQHQFFSASQSPRSASHNPSNLSPAAEPQNTKFGAEHEYTMELGRMHRAAKHRMVRKKEAPCGPHTIAVVTLARFPSTECWDKFSLNLNLRVKSRSMLKTMILTHEFVQTLLNDSPKRHRLQNIHSETNSHCFYQDMTQGAVASIETRCKNGCLGDSASARTGASGERVDHPKVDWRQCHTPVTKPPAKRPTAARETTERDQQTVRVLSKL